VPILVFLGLFVLDLGPMYATYRHLIDRQTSDAHHRLMPILRHFHDIARCWLKTMNRGSPWNFVTPDGVSKQNDGTTRSRNKFDYL